MIIKGWAGNTGHGQNENMDLGWARAIHPKKDCPGRNLK
jgi:hypothetical protein